MKTYKPFKLYKILAFFIIIALISSCSSKVSDTESDLIGIWKFRTNAKKEFTEISDSLSFLEGSLVLRNNESEEGLFCELTTYQKTEVFNKFTQKIVTNTTSATQSCKVFVDGKRININSTVVKASSENYIADNFELKFNGKEMTGIIASNINLVVKFVKASRSDTLDKVHTFTDTRDYLAFAAKKGWNKNIVESVEGCIFASKDKEIINKIPTRFTFRSIYICPFINNSGEETYYFEAEKIYDCDNNSSETIQILGFNKAEKITDSYTNDLTKDELFLKTSYKNKHSNPKGILRTSITNFCSN